MKRGLVICWQSGAILGRANRSLLYRAMNKTIEIEVTLLATTKNYTVEPTAVTGIEDEAVALLALRQAFIASGMGLAKASLLKRHPVPAGMKAGDWVKTLAKEVADGDFPTAEEIWADAKVKAAKAYERETKVDVAGLKAQLAEMEAKLKAAGLM